MKLIFITVGEPLSQIEAFLFTEIESIVFYNKNITIFPLISNKLSGESHLFKYIVNTPFLTRWKIISRQVFKKNFRLASCLLKIMFAQKPKRILYSIYFLPRTLLLIDYVEQESIDHIHAYWGTTPATCALIASKLTGVPFSFTVHRADVDNNDILKVKAESAAFVRCISKKGFNTCLKYCNPHKIKILHMGVHIPPAQKTIKMRKVIRIVAVARLIPTKMIVELILSVSKLKNTRLFIIGDGPLRKKIQSMLKKLKLDKRVKLLGFLAQKQIFSLYQKRAFDLFVLPSRNEGIPVSAMEAMAYSIPTAITQVGAAGELINKKNGYFLKHDLSNLELIVQSIPDKEKIKNAQLKVSKYYNSRKNAKGLLTLIEKS